MLTEDGKKIILWADRPDALEAGKTALWYGDQVDVEAARQFLAEKGVGIVGMDSEVPSAADLVAAQTVCTVWAYTPDFQTNGVDRMEAEVSHFCTAGGSWISHRVKGRLLKKRWLIYWWIEDSADSGWVYQPDNLIWESLRKDCANNEENTWRTWAKGWVEYSGGYDEEVHHSETVDERCGT